MLKADPEMIKAIYNASTANNGEQHKDNNVTKYLESNKDRIIDLVEKNYENLVEALTNNAIFMAFISSSNPIVLLPQSSFTFPTPSTQTDTYRTENSENFHNSKGNIAD
jgi:hypothetical protein